MPPRRLFLAISCALLALAGVAQAGPPFVTDDPEPVELHHWEINIGSQHFHSADGWSGGVSIWDINYGALSDLQLHVQPAMVYNKTAGEPARFGFADLELGAKFRFIHETDTLPQVALYPLVELPTGNRNEDLGNGKAQVFIPIWLQKSFGKWTTYGGGGYWFNPGPGNRDHWYAGWEIQRKLTKSFALGGEIQFRTPDSVDAHTSVALNGGGIWDLSETYHILFSAGHSVKGPAEFQGYLALQVTFGPEETGKDKK